MSLWLSLARLSTVVNLGLLLVLGSLWLRNYRQHGASHTLGFLVVAAFLLVENVLWLYFYVFHSTYVDWFLASAVDVQVGMTMLCTLELVALVALVRLTWV